MMMTAEQAQRVGRLMAQVGVSAAEAAAAMERMRPVLAEAYRQLMLLSPSSPFRFRLWLLEQPRWQRPFMRLAYRIERLVLR